MTSSALHNDPDCDPGAGDPGRRLRCFLLPGLDGSGILFDPFVNKLPDDLVPQVIAYDADGPRGYRDLQRDVEEQLPTDGRFVVVAESFSGPIAIRIAAQNPAGLVALVLVGTFAGRPLGFCSRAVAKLLPPVLFALPLPLIVLRWLLTGGDDALARRVRDVVLRLDPAVVAHRAREALQVDAMAELVRISVPILHLTASADRLLGHGPAAEMSRRKAGMVLREIAAPHLILQSRPRESVAAILSFLNGIEVFGGR